MTPSTVPAPPAGPSENSAPAGSARALTAWLAFLVLAPLVAWVATNWSRDYGIYIDLINDRESTDPMFEAYMAVGRFLGLSAPTIYVLFSTTLVGALVYFLSTRRVSAYWIWIYLLSFGLLHVVTQVRAGMASVVIAILLTSTRRWLQLLTPVAVGIHASAVLFMGAGFARRRLWLIVLWILAPLGLLAVVGAQSDKLAQYARDVNESQSISIAVAAYAVVLLAVLFSRLDRATKTMLLSIGLLTLGAYIAFLDLKAISNRFVELSQAATILLMGALDRPRNDHRPVFSAWIKLMVLGATLLLFYVSNVSNSILNV